VKNYLYWFNQYAWYDKIFIYDKDDFNYDEWDIIKDWENLFLVLWKEISFSENYNTIYNKTTDFSIIEEWLLKKETINIINRMVYEWYTSYKNVIKLFCNPEIEKLLIKKPQKISKKIWECHLWKHCIESKKGEQILIIVPDIRSYNNIIEQSKFKWIFLYSLDTQNKKDSNRWKIKTWEESLIVSTSSEIFQDYNNLKEIIFIEPQKWYYESQQDPRYKIETVIKKLWEEYNTKIKIIESEEIF
jgi:primosomal protein N'